MTTIPRKFLHMLAMSPFFVAALFMDTHVPRIWYVVLSLIMLVCFLLFEVYRLQHPPFNEMLFRIFHPYIFKAQERHRVFSGICGPIDMLLLALFFSKSTVICAFIIASYSDPIAAIVGMRFGGKKNAVGRTWMGTFAFFASAALLLLVAENILNVPLAPLTLVGLAALAALIEHRINFLDDNFIVPMAFAVSMELALLY